MFLELLFWNRLCLLENMGFECDKLVVCHCWIWTNMLNCICCFWTEHENSVCVLLLD